MVAQPPTTFVTAGDVDEREVGEARFLLAETYPFVRALWPLVTEAKGAVIRCIAVLFLTED